MKKSFLILVSTLFLSFGLYSCSTSDEKISKEVGTLLSSYSDAKVEIKDGVVTLSGVAQSENIRGQIAELAKSVKGVKSVVNNLDIKPQIVINSDANISSGITTALSAAGFTGITAAVKNGEVTLTGNINRPDLIKVMQVVNATSPKKINNQLNLK